MKMMSLSEMRILRMLSMIVEDDDEDGDVDERLSEGSEDFEPIERPVPGDTTQRPPVLTMFDRSQCGLVR